MAIRPSLRLAILLLLFHLTVAVAVYLTAMPLAARMAMLVTILLSLFYYLLRDALLLLPNSCRGILLDQNSVSITTQNGSLIQGSVVNNTVVSPLVILLRAKLEGHLVPVSFVIFPDALGAGVFRELCVYLKFACSPSELKNHSQGNHSNADKVSP